MKRITGHLGRPSPNPWISTPSPPGQATPTSVKSRPLSPEQAQIRFRKGAQIDPEAESPRVQKTAPLLRLCRQGAGDSMLARTSDPTSGGRLRKWKGPAPEVEASAVKLWQLLLCLYEKRNVFLLGERDGLRAALAGRFPGKTAAAKVACSPASQAQCGLHGATGRALTGNAALLGIQSKGFELLQ
ncbi:hypothetical protein H920_00218 [Fukomys damarensis]|uniref:Uncharacterized protein n=1 Tax=Fukomys damarensis TaxID=885580 RepID=A0A091E1Y0_FUKDA|nr:hypothetical protein H920_00218 [Fukomys damarensis]